LPGDRSGGRGGDGNVWNVLRQWLCLSHTTVHIY
jgi:hypothetical protein